jgi:hypothetical protein
VDVEKDITRLRGQVVEGPDGVREQIDQLTKELGAQGQALTEAERGVQEIRSKSDALEEARPALSHLIAPSCRPASLVTHAAQVERDVGDALRALQLSETELNKFKEAARGVRDREGTVLMMLSSLSQLARLTASPLS